MKTDDREPVTRIDEALDLLPRDIEPPRDLWPAIEARLEPRAVRGGRRWPWLAAAGVLLVVGSSLITANLVRREAAVTAQAPIEQPDAAAMRTAFGPGQHSARAMTPSGNSSQIRSLRASTACLRRRAPSSRRISPNCIVPPPRSMRPSS